MMNERYFNCLKAIIVVVVSLSEIVALDTMLDLECTSVISVLAPPFETDKKLAILLQIIIQLQRSIFDIPIHINI